MRRQPASGSHPAGHHLATHRIELGPAMLSEDTYRALVDAIYEAALDPTAWRQVVDRLTAGFQAIGASMFTPVAIKLGLEPVWAADADPEFVAAYASKYAH